MPASPKVAVCGPTSWNHLILLDRLPEPVPHMQFARRSWQSVGGTSAGKAAHLADLGIEVTLRSPTGTDDDGGQVRRALTAAGVRVEMVASERTERHVNLMTDDKTGDPGNSCGCAWSGVRAWQCARAVQKAGSRWRRTGPGIQ